MKKVFAVLLAMGLVVGLSVGQAFAQDKKVVFSLNLGAMTNLGSGGSFNEVWFTFSAQADIHIVPAFAISPEVMAITDDSFSFSPLLLYPGIILNYVSKGGLFVGAGAVLPIVFWEGESETGDLLPKINVGYRARHLKVTAYLITDTEELFESNLIGLSLGYCF